LRPNWFNQRTVETANRGTTFIFSDFRLNNDFYYHPTHPATAGHSASAFNGDIVRLIKVYY